MYLPFAPSSYSKEVRKAIEFLMGSGKRFFEFATKLGELMLLNLLTLLCSLPVVTVGAAFTAMHRVLVDIYRDQENKLVKTSFKSFKENFPRPPSCGWCI